MLDFFAKLKKYNFWDADRELKVGNVSLIRIPKITHAFMKYLYQDPILSYFPQN